MASLLLQVSINCISGIFIRNTVLCPRDAWRRGQEAGGMPFLPLKNNRYSSILLSVCPDLYSLVLPCPEMQLASLL